MTLLHRYQPARFAVVGGGVALLYVVLYLALQALGVSQPLANTVAFLLAVAVQYVGQTVYTFRGKLVVPNQMSRFIGMILVGLLVSNLITGRLGPALGWADWISAVVVTVVLPVQNYLFLKIWVFSEKFASSEG